MNEKREQIKYDDYSLKYGDSWREVQKTLGILNAGQTAIFTSGLIVNLIFSALDCYAGVMTPGDFVMLQALFLQIATPLNLLGTMFREVDDSFVQFEDIKKILNTKPRVFDKEDAKDFEFKEGKIEFKNVSFSFSPEKKESVYLLKDLSMTIEPHKQTAIVGSSGFGKTTILNLIVSLGV
jgi:ATP-binding cassette subfamily B protein